MKALILKSIFFSMLFCMSLIAWSQVPENFSWQAVIRDDQGEILADSTITFRFTIDEMGILDFLITIYSEDQVATTNEFGMVSLLIGTGEVNFGQFNEIKWEDDHYLSVWINTGSGFTEIYEEPLSAVPFAMVAKNNWGLKGNYIDPDYDFFGTTNAAPLRFRVSYSPKMIITEEGRVGIGTEDPAYNLDIHNPTSTGFTSLAINRGQVNSSNFTSARLTDNGTRLIINYSGASESGAIELKPNFGGAQLPGMIINSGPEVGIGFVSPSSIRASLHIGVGSDASLTNDDSGFLLIGDVGGNNMVLDQNEILARSNGATQTLFLNTSGGAVVINQNTTPGFDFAVNGTAARPGGGSWYALSDARMKENVNPFSSGLEMIRDVKPITFHYNQQSGYDTEIEYVGVIAQELQQVAPFMVEEKTMEFESGEKENYLTVDPSAFTYLLINAVKELEQQNASQNEMIEQLTKMNGELLQRLEALEKK